MVLTLVMWCDKIEQTFERSVSMSKYGIPYKGRKSKIAKDILNALPSGNRLVDLFGGGFSITDCALREFPNKWNRFMYNDVNPLLQPLIEDAINGK